MFCTHVLYSCSFCMMATAVLHWWLLVLMLDAVAEAAGKSACSDGQKHDSTGPVATCSTYGSAEYATGSVAVVVRAVCSNPPFHPAPPCAPVEAQEPAQPAHTSQTEHRSESLVCRWLVQMLLTRMLRCPIGVCSTTATLIMMTHNVPNIHLCQY